MINVYEIIKQHKGNGCEIEKAIAINKLIYARIYNTKQAYKYYTKYPEFKDIGEPTLLREYNLLKEALQEFPEYYKMPNYIEAKKLLQAIDISIPPYMRKIN